jgi:hypothetical protein
MGILRITNGTLITYFFGMVNVLMCACNNVPEEVSSLPIKEPDLKTEIVLPPDTTRNVKLQSIVVLPCANGYDFASANMELESEIVEVLQDCDFIKAHQLSLKGLHGLNVYGLWHEKDLEQIRSKLTEDFFVVCRMNEPFHEELARSESKKWGYSLKIYERKSGKLRGRIMENGLTDFAAIREDLNSHCSDFLTFLKAH